MSKKRRRSQTESEKQAARQPVRIGDLITIFWSRYGGGRLFVFPNDDAGREDLHVLLDHYSLAYPHAILRVLKARAPWLTGIEREDLLQEVTRHPRFWRSRELAIKLNLTEAERRKYAGERKQIRTIAAVDVSDDERKRLRKARNAEHQRAKRRARGAKSRDEWLAANSKSRTKPWLALGTGRSVYYAKLKAGRLTGAGQVRQQQPLRSGDEPVRTSKLEGRDGIARGRCSPWAVPEPKGSARGEAEMQVCLPDRCGQGLVQG